MTCDEVMFPKYALNKADDCVMCMPGPAVRNTIRRKNFSPELTFFKYLFFLFTIIEKTLLCDNSTGNNATVYLSGE